MKAVNKFFQQLTFDRRTKCWGWVRVWIKPANSELLPGWGHALCSQGCQGCQIQQHMKSWFCDEIQNSWTSQRSEKEWWLVTFRLWRCLWWSSIVSDGLILITIEWFRTEQKVVFFITDLKIYTLCAVHCKCQGDSARQGKLLLNC